MSCDERIEQWRQDIPCEERFETVENVLKEKFEKVEWKRGSKIKITDNRLLIYKRLRPGDADVALDGSFKIPTVKGRKVKGFYIRTILHMLDIIEAYERNR
jgi:hypothetical protein